MADTREAGQVLPSFDGGFFVTVGWAREELNPVIGLVWTGWRDVVAAYDVLVNLVAQFGRKGEEWKRLLLLLPVPVKTSVCHQRSEGKRHTRCDHSSSGA
jgi:hypothetical protein